MPTYIKYKCPCCGSDDIRTGALLPNGQTIPSIWCGRCGTYSADKAVLNPFLYEIKEESENSKNSKNSKNSDNEYSVDLKEDDIPPGYDHAKYI